MSLVFDLRCNRCGYYFPMPLEETSCPHCDAAEERWRRIEEAADKMLAAWESRSDMPMWQAVAIFREAKK